MWSISPKVVSHWCIHLFYPCLYRFLGSVPRGTISCRMQGIFCPSIYIYLGRMVNTFLQYYYLVHSPLLSFLYRFLILFYNTTTWILTGLEGIKEGIEWFSSSRPIFHSNSLLFHFNDNLPPSPTFTTTTNSSPILTTATNSFCCQQKRFHHRCFHSKYCSSSSPAPLSRYYATYHHHYHLNHRFINIAFIATSAG